ncbi:hypothetical protein CVT26_006110 [Gymnopilus dilepis]|uniref:Uncharacterized protein n=1 Tax=Gymnopilus dilepis TaxID=231916 RepID=A0A409WGE0_9AGAR|nr:hypothetical protein CVT26_006110 [Gymnopilus dilepis]
MSSKSAGQEKRGSSMCPFRHAVYTAADVVCALCNPQSQTLLSPHYASTSWIAIPRLQLPKVSVSQAGIAFIVLAPRVSGISLSLSKCRLVLNSFIRDSIHAAMVNPGSFRGSRKEFLLSQKAVYAEAVAGGFAADALADIQRKYFKRYPIDLDHNEEPSEEHLASVNDDVADADPEEPNRESLSEEEYERKVKELQQRAELIRYRKAQIKRWMAYQHMKDQDSDPMEPSPTNPYNSLIFQLSGKEPTRPRKKTAVNVWRKSQRHNIEVRVKNLAKTQGIPNDRLAALRDKVARDMFHALPLDQQDKWKKQAEEESVAANEEWERLRKSGPSKKPEDRQICIQSVVRVTQPFIDTLSESTGWNWTLIGGGPEPAHGGQLNIISVHAGLTPGEVKMNFGRAERADYKKYFVPVFGRFLKKCFSPEECRARALVDTEGLVALSADELESSGANLDTIDYMESQDGQNDLTSTSTSDSSQTPLNSSDVAISTPATSLDNTSSSYPSPPVPPSAQGSAYSPVASAAPSLDAPPDCHLSDLSTSPNSSDHPSLSVTTSPASHGDALALPNTQVTCQSLERRSDEDRQEDRQEQPEPRPVTPPRTASSISYQTTPPHARMATPPLSPRASPRHAHLTMPPLSPRASPPPRGNPQAMNPQADSPMADVSMAHVTMADGLAVPQNAELQLSSASLPPPQVTASPVPEAMDLQADPAMIDVSIADVAMADGSAVLRDSRLQLSSTTPTPTQIMAFPAKTSEVSGPLPAARHPSPPSSYPTPPADPDPMPVGLDSTLTNHTSTSAGSDATRSTRSSLKRRSTESSPDSHPPAKRGCKSGVSTTVLSTNLSPTTKTISPPSNAPKWFENALLMLQDVSLGSKWSSLLHAWANFEMEAEFQENGKLGTQDRPVCIGEWIQRRRSTTWRPTFNVEEVEFKFNKWWTSLQPGWRVLGGEIQHSVTEGDWSFLRKPGLNGLFSVLVALFYWGLVVEKASENHKRWVKAVDDVHLALLHISDSNERSGG